MKFFAALFALLFATSAQAAPVSVEFMARLVEATIYRIQLYSDPFEPPAYPYFSVDAVPGGRLTINGEFGYLFSNEWRKVSISLDDEEGYGSEVKCLIGNFDCSAQLSHYANGETRARWRYASWELTPGQFFMSMDEVYSGTLDGVSYNALGANFYLETMPVPLPSSLALLMASFGAIIVMRRRSSKSECH